MAGKQITLEDINKIFSFWFDQFDKRLSEQNQNLERQITALGVTVSDHGKSINTLENFQANLTGKITVALAIASFIMNLS